MKKHKKLIRVFAVILAVLMPVLTAVSASATGSGGGIALNEKYAKPDINVITGMGQEPEELSVSAGAVYQEKAWYEYVTYSEHAVSSYKVSDESRILFYDPYTYTNSMIMDVKFDAETTDFDTMSSYTISHTNSKTIDACISSTDTYSDAVQTSGKDYSGSNVKNIGTTKTIYNHSIDNPTYGTKTETTTYKYGECRYTESSDSTTSAGSDDLNNLFNSFMQVASGFALGNISGITSGLNIMTGGNDSRNHAEYDKCSIVKEGETNTTTYSDDYKTSTEYTGSDTVEYNTESATEGWEQLSARVTKTVGSSISTSNSWSESESTTVTKTYAATHFAADGVTPLPWAIVHYTVQMPMKCCLQYKYEGEWITVSTVYCLLTTVKGTCRAWMQNGQVYYEDWGSGEPVVETQFWSQFMTREKLMAAYTDKLYPVGGDD